MLPEGFYRNKNIQNLKRGKLRKIENAFILISLFALHVHPDKLFVSFFLRKRIQKYHQAKARAKYK